MNKFVLWGLSIIFLLIGLFSSATSLVASLLYLLGAAYLSPIVRSRYLSRLNASFFMKTKGTLAIALVLFFAGATQIRTAQDSAAVDKLVEQYQKNSTQFVDRVSKNIEEKKYFLAIIDLDNVLQRLPDDEKLKSLRHSAQISELKYIASKDELYLFSEEDFLQYKKIMGGSAKVDEVESLYSELAEAKAKKLIAKEDISGARVQVNNIKKISPTSKKIAPLTDQISSLEDKLKPKEATEDMTKKNAVQPSLSTLQPSGNAGDGLSKVVGKVGSLIYLANGKTFAIERPTMLHVDGQIYPKGSGNPDYIQIGYRCRFTGTEFEVAEVFCER